MHECTVKIVYLCCRTAECSWASLQQAFIMQPSYCVVEVDWITYLIINRRSLLTVTTATSGCCGRFEGILACFGYANTPAMDKKRYGAECLELSPIQVGADYEVKQVAFVRPLSHGQTDARLLRSRRLWRHPVGHCGRCEEAAVRMACLLALSGQGTTSIQDMFIRGGAPSQAKDSFHGILRLGPGPPSGC